MSQKGSGVVILSKKPTGRAESMPIGLGQGVLFALVSMLIQCGLFSWMILKAVVGDNAIGYGAMVIVFLSAMLGAIVAASKIKRRRLLVCLMTGLLFLASLLLITVIFFGCRFDGVITTIIVTLMGSGTASLFSLPKKERHKSVRFKMYSC